MMRNTALALFIFAGTAFATESYSQTMKVTVVADNVSTGKVINEIEKQTDYLFVYNVNEVNLKRNVKVNAQNKSVAEVLNKVFEGTDIYYAMEGKNIMLMSKAKEAEATRQANKITGIVKDANGEPIIGANVMVKGQSIGTITDIDGQFMLDAPKDAVLQISYIGYVSQEVKVTGKKELNITLKEDTETLDEVVVVGFGTQKKVNLTGAVDVVDNKQLSERPVSNAVQALQGIAPGLVITQSGGDLESRPSINVRGMATIGEGTSGSPLILIDGMEADLNSVNPQDIESISILKDAAASSIYGSRAPFGVILVTTKSGDEGKVTINYNNSFRFGTPIHKNTMMNSVNFAAWMNDTFVNGGKGLYFGIDPNGNNRFNEIVEYHNATPVSNGVRQTADGKFVYSLPRYNETGQWQGGFSNGIDDVDYYDIVYKDWNFSQEHNFSASGGSKKFSYYASGSFYTQDGLLKLGDEGLDRYTATAKINSELTSWLRFRYNMRFTREDQNRPTAQTKRLYEKLGGDAWPVLPLYDRNGNPFFSSDNNVWALEYGGETYWQTDNSYHQLGLTFEPIKRWITNIDFNYRIKSTNQHYDRLPYYNYDINGNRYDRNPTSYAHEDYYKNNYYNFNVRSQYSFSLQKKHNFTAMIGMQIENLKETKFGLKRVGLILNDKTDIDMTTGIQNGEKVSPDVNGSRGQWGTVGIFGRFNYDFESRYLFEANIRRDGSSRFRKGNQWKSFPSFSLGWNAAEENFMKDTRSWLDMLKLRISYGTLGNQNTENWYHTYQTLSVKAQGGNWLQNGSLVPIAYAPGLVSETLTWEEIETFNAGVDFALLNNRLTGSFNWYVRNTNNMVGAAPALPEILGTDVPKTNNTDLQTKGWELSIGWRDVLNNNLSYGIKFNVFDSRTKITRYPNNPTGNIDTYMEGRMIGEIWGYETVGLAKTDKEMEEHLASLPNGGQDHYGSNWGAGDIMYKDLNKDGKITSGSRILSDYGDLRVIGNDTPRFQFGLDLTASWKGFDFRAFFNGTMKRDYWIDSCYMFGTPGGQWGCAGITEVNDYFRDENTWSVQQGVNGINTNAYLPRPLYEDKNLQVQTRYLQNAAYIRLKNLTVGYTFPKKFTNKLNIGTARVYFSGENLWTATGLLSQFDPETIGSYNGNSYPLSTTLSCGLSINF